jgi:hypothetical protein
MTKKRGFQEVVTDLRRYFNVLIVLSTFARSMIVFLISFLLLSTIGITWWYSLFPGVVCFIVLHHLASREDPAKIIEREHPELEDMLTTARDNVEETNEMIRGLHNQVEKKLKKVSSSSLVKSSRLKKDISFAAMLALIIVLIAPFNPVLLSIEISLEEFGINIERSVVGFGGDDESVAGSGLEGGDNVNNDIFGDKKVAVLGDDGLDIAFGFGDDKIDITNIQKPKSLEFKASYPDEIGAVASSSFEEDIPMEQQEVVKNYYKKITEG